jgi:hypothetical protein
VVQTVDRDEDGRNPARRRPNLAGKGRGSGVGSPGVRFETVWRLEDAPAMENGGTADLRPPLPLLRRACSQWTRPGGHGGWSGAVGRLR